MSTSGGGLVNAICYVVVLFASVGAAAPIVVRDRVSPRRIPPAAVALWLVVAVPSLVELAAHGIFDALSRQPDRIRSGQVWRLVTSAVVQDGGLFGTVFNLVILAVVAPVALALWGGVRGWLVFGIGAIGFDLIATFAFPSPGGGNSAATFVLATSMVGVLVIRRRTPRTLVSAAVVVIVGVLLLVLSDAHGLAVLGGLVVGVLLAAGTRTVPARSLSEPEGTREPDRALG